MYIRNAMFFHALMMQIVCADCAPVRWHANIAHTSAIAIACHLQMLILWVPEYIVFSFALCAMLTLMLLLNSQDIISEHPERFFVAEIIREKIFLQYRNEIPYVCQVVIKFIFYIWFTNLATSPLPTLQNELGLEKLERNSRNNYFSCFLYVKKKSIFLFRYYIYKYFLIANSFRWMLKAIRHDQKQKILYRWRFWLRETPRRLSLLEKYVTSIKIQLIICELTLLIAG